ncbi:MAG: aldose 1-epimerase family protein [Pseudomonadota bacterium]|nr:aldose 1-epimerase family protein [Pseudomonadota bacterium]
MKLSVLSLAAALAATPALAWEVTLLDTTQPMTERRITSAELGIQTVKPFTVTTRLLHGGRQEGVSLVEIDTGAMVITVVPTRGMNVLKAVAGDVRLGWDSPVKEVVNPAFIELNGRNGLGWLEGFNELVTRCGFEWVGHPGTDTNGDMLTLHGLASNIPASKVVLSIDDKPPHTIRLKGVLREQAFKKVDFLVDTELRTTPGATAFTVHDRLTNQGDYAKEYQALYHTNFGPPLLEEGARFAAPVREVSPFNDYAKKDLATWQTYRGPTRDYDEMVYNVFPYGDAQGNTLAVLHTANGGKGISMAYNVNQLPAFSLWKNTDTNGQGYVTGLEPGTSFSYNRRYQRDLKLVPTIGPKETRDFEITYTLLDSKAKVDEALGRVHTILAGRPTSVRQEPLVKLP